MLPVSENDKLKETLTAAFAGIDYEALEGIIFSGGLIISSLSQPSTRTSVS